MNEELDVFSVVKYFTEKSGMLFFYTKEDVKIGYDRIKTMLSCNDKYNGIDVTKELEILDAYYKYFVENFDEYSQIEDNKKLFIDIMRYDSSIMFCGNSASLRKYVLEVEKEIKEQNKELPFFKRGKFIKNEMKELRKLVERIEDYKIFYELDVPTNKIDEVLSFLKLSSFTNKEDIAKAYNALLDKEYNDMINSATSMHVVISKDKQFNYFRDIISGSYSNIKLAPSLLERYSMSDVALQKAFAYFKLSSDCNQKQLMDAITSTFDEIKSLGTRTHRSNVVLNERSVYVNDGIRALNSNGNTDFDTNIVLEVANFYKDVLYNKFGVKEKIVVTPVIKKKNGANIERNNADNLSFATLFSGLSYNDAEKLYYTLMSRLLNSGDTTKEQDIRNLEIYWNSIKDNLFDIQESNSNNIPKR